MKTTAFLTILHKKVMHYVVYFEFLFFHLFTTLKLSNFTSFSVVVISRSHFVVADAVVLKQGKTSEPMKRHIFGYDTT